MSVITDAIRLQRDRRAKTDASFPTRKVSRTTLPPVSELTKKGSFREKIRETGAKSCKGTFKRFFRKAYKRLNLKYLIPLALVAIYTVLGAVMFLAIERGTDQSNLDDQWRLLEEMRLQVVDDLDETIAKTSLGPITRRQIKEIYRKAFLNYESKFGDITGMSFSSDTKWDIWNAMYFCGTIYTTIGYGNIFCKTVGGQVATVIYMLFGIPLVLTTLNDLGIFLFKLIRSSLRRGDHLIRRFKAERDRRLRLRHLSKQQNDTNSVDLSVSLDVEAQKEESSDDELEIALSEHEKNEIMNIPVSAALFVTMAWIFMCSGLFCIWETNWDYWTSVYFFFISLSTIGLGDVTPDHPRAMILMFGVVLVGLSLVSMSINVVQMRLEELYVQLLMKILTEYQQRMQSGSGEADATMGMMDAWQDSKSAKLLKLLPKSKMNNVMQQFNDAAKAKGIEVPAVLQDVDFDKGLPRCLTIASKDEDERREGVEAVIEQAEDKVQQTASPLEQMILDNFASQTSLLLDEKGVQTALLQLVDNTSQFSIEVRDDSGIQTDYIESESVEAQTEFEVSLTESDSQTVDTLETLDHDSQTESPQVCSEEIQVEPSVTDAEIQGKITSDDNESVQTDPLWGVSDVEQQTAVVSSADQVAQVCFIPEIDADTQTDVLNTLDTELQTDTPPVLATEMQTDIAIFLESETQTDRTPEPEPMSPAQTNLEKLRRAFHKRRKEVPERAHSTTPPKTVKRLSVPHAIREKSEEPAGDTIEEEAEELEDESEGSVESLQWDPVDGMHAEKQRSVNALKGMFEIPGAASAQQQAELNPKLVRRHTTKAYGQIPRSSRRSMDL